MARPLEPGEARAARPAGRAAGVLCAIAFVAIGGWIFYNTNIVNEYLPSDVVLDRQARFEKEYRKYKDLPQPRIADVYADVDIYPAQRRVEIRGRYQLVNKTAAPIRDLHVTLLPGARVARDVAGIGEADRRTTRRPAIASTAWQSRCRPAPRWSCGSRSSARSAASPTPACRRPAAAATCARGSTTTARSSTASTCSRTSATTTGGQILDRNERRKRGLGDVPRAAKLEDESARGSMGFQDADWINFETVVSTSADQIALAPGYLQREWTQDGRRYFHYKMDRPMLPFFCYLSARWRSAARRLARPADRGLLRRQASVQRRSHDRGDAQVARLLHGALLAVPAQAGAHPRVPALRALRAELRQHDSVLRIDRLRRRPARSATTSTTSSTSPRTRSRTSGGRTR